MRSDVNISLRPVGSETLGTRTEIKNMNSFTYMEKAMRYEIERQADLLDSGEKVVQDTLRYLTDEDRTEPMRSKEDAHDYRYFREPDLVTIAVSEERIERLRSQLPELPQDRKKRYIEELQIPPADADLLCRHRRIAEYFEAAAAGTKNPKTAANCMLGQIFRRLVTEEDKEKAEIPIPPQYLHDLIVLLDEGKIKNNLLKSTLEKMLDTGEPASAFIREEDMGGVDDETLRRLCAESLAKNPKAGEYYKKGKVNAAKSLLGYVMKATRGRADAPTAEKILIELIENS